MKVFHCTRLIDEEIDDICRNGLRPLVAVHLEQRIVSLEALGLISDQIRDRLIGHHEASALGRPGLVSFIAKKEELSIPEFVGPFLNFWGGEALTLFHATDPITGPVLWTLGTACIFELDRTASPDEPEYRTFAAVPASQIVDVHRYGSSSFEDLTGCSRWPAEFSLERPLREQTHKAWRERVLGEAI